MRHQIIDQHSLVTCQPMRVTAMLLLATVVLGGKKPAPVPEPEPGMPTRFATAHRTRGLRNRHCCAATVVTATLLPPVRCGAVRSANTKINAEATKRLEIHITTAEIAR